MRKPSVLVPALVLAAAALFPAAARAQEDGYPFRLANFSFELLGGWAKLSPADLNALAGFEDAYVRYYYVTRFDYYRNLYGEAYRVTTTRAGDSGFRGITGGFAAGFRLRYDLSPSLGLSIGIQALDRQQHSSVGLTVGVRDEGRDYVDYGGPRSYAYQNTGFLLGVTAWVPDLAAHFGWQFGPVFRFEALIAGGPMFVACRALSERRTSATDASGFVSSSLSVLDMRGTTSGFSGELGARLSVRTGGRMDLFVEGAYSFREAGEVRGPGSSRTMSYDSNAAQDPSVSSWTGVWGNAWTEITSAWGKLSAFAPQNKMKIGEGSGAYKFALNLSGLQVRAGLAVRL